MALTLGALITACSTEFEVSTIDSGDQNLSSEQRKEEQIPTENTVDSSNPPASPAENESITTAPKPAIDSTIISNTTPAVESGLITESGDIVEGSLSVSYDPESLLCLNEKTIEEFQPCSSQTNKTLVNSNLTQLDLSGSDFSGAVLQNVDLSGTNLESSNFTNTTINNTTFTGTNLLFCDFNQAQVTNSTLSETRTYEELLVANAMLNSTNTLPETVVQAENLTLQTDSTDSDTKFTLEAIKNYLSLIAANRTEARSQHDLLIQEKRGTTDCRIKLTKTTLKIKQAEKLEKQLLETESALFGKIREKREEVHDESDENKKQKLREDFENMVQLKKNNNQNILKLKFIKKKYENEDLDSCKEQSEASQYRITKHKNLILKRINDNTELWKMIYNKIQLISNKQQETRTDENQPSHQSPGKTQRRKN